MFSLDISSVKLWRSVFLLAFAASIGCQSGQFRATNLPAEFRANPETASHKIDFAQIASPGSGKNRIAPGDLLEVTVSTGREDEKIQPALARVGDNGSVDIPIIGSVPVAGMEAFDASQNIVDLGIQRGMYHHPLVTVEIKSKAVNQVTVLGAVEEPGIHEIPRGNCDLISALAAAGGLSEDASTEIEIIHQPKPGLASHAAQQSQRVIPNANGVQLTAYQNLQQPLAHKHSHTAGSQSPQTQHLDLATGNPFNKANYQLSDRDIIRVISRKKEVIHVAGLVKDPGQFELPKDQELRLLDAIALAGGRSSAVGDKIFIIRQPQDRPEPVIIQASLSKAKQNGLENLRLMAGDTITIEQTPATAFVDTVSKFFRLSFGVASNTIF